MAAVTHHCHYEPCKSIATQRCSGCKTTYYCGKDHQALDWNAGGHREQCKKIQSTASEAIQITKTEKQDNSSGHTEDPDIAAWKDTISIDPQHPYAYYAIGFKLFPNSTTMLNGRLWSAFDLVKHSIFLNSNFVGPLMEMALHLSPIQSIDIKGVLWTKITCYTRAIELDPDYFVPYHNLAVILPTHGTVKINGKDWTKQDLAKQAKALNTSGEEVPPFIEVRHYYEEKNDAAWRKKAYREEVWGDQSMDPFEKWQQDELSRSKLRMQEKLDRQLEEFRKSAFQKPE